MSDAVIEAQVGLFFARKDITVQKAQTCPSMTGWKVMSLCVPVGLTFLLCLDTTDLISLDHLAAAVKHIPEM